MNPPRHLIEGMRREGPLGEIVSMLSLCAAIAIKRGVPIEEADIRDWNGQALDEQTRAFLKRTMAQVHVLLRRGTPDEIDHAIALYRAHLKAAGYVIEEGRPS